MTLTKVNTVAEMMIYTVAPKRWTAYSDDRLIHQPHYVSDKPETDA